MVNMVSLPRMCKALIDFFVRILAHIQQLWSSSRQSQKEFELVSRIPAVLGSLRAGKELRGEGAVTGVFREIGDLVCENLSAVLIGQRHNVTVNNDFISCAVKEDRIDNSAPAIAVLRKERHPLFQNTTEELMEALQIDLSRRCEIQSDGSQLLSTPTRSYFNGLSVISASAVLRASVVGPLIAAINRTSAAAASALVRVPRLLSTAEGGDSGERLSKGFMLMHHMEYLRMLFLMGGETIRPWGPIATDSSADPTQSHWQQSPGAVFVSLQEAYCVLLDRKIQRQHESINVMARGEINPMSDARGTDFMAFSPELYTLSQGMLSQLMASLPIHEAAHHASSAGSEGLSTGTSVGVAVSFRPGGGTDFRTSEATAVKPSSPWASAAVAALLSDHLAVELYYPFPLNKVITPVVIKRLRSVLMELLNITTLRWAVESTWKLDKISKAVFEKVIIGYKGAGEVLVLKKCLDRCRVSLSWLVHTIRGILYYFMSEIHDILWARLCEDMQMASQISITKQGIAVELFVAHVQGLLSLYEISISALLAKGHAAVSAYQLALLAMRDVCNCSQQESATEISLDSSRTPLLVAKCVAALKRADLEFAALRISLGDFLDVLGSLGGDGSRSISGSRVWNAGMAGIVNAADRMASGGEWNREASRAFAVNEARRLNAILGGAWNSYK